MGQQQALDSGFSWLRVERLGGLGSGVAGLGLRAHPSCQLLGNYGGLDLHKKQLVNA